MVQVRLATNQYFRVGGHWLRVDSQARERIAEKCLWPGYTQFRQQSYYDALAYWGHGLELAGIIGDLQPSERGTFTNPISQHVGDSWDFEVEGVDGWDLLQVADAIARRHAVPDFYSIAKQFREKDDYARALDVYHLALAFAEKDRDAVSQANILDGLAAVYRRLGALRSCDRVFVPVSGYRVLASPFLPGSLAICATLSRTAIHIHSCGH